MHWLPFKATPFNQRATAAADAIELRIYACYFEWRPLITGDRPDIRAFACFFCDEYDGLPIGGGIIKGFNWLAIELIRFEHRPVSAVHNIDLEASGFLRLLIERQDQ